MSKYNLDYYRAISRCWCDYTTKCANDRCILRLKDCFGYPRVYRHDDAYTEEIKVALKAAGLNSTYDIDFPNISVLVGADAIYVECGDKREQKKQ